MICSLLLGHAFLWKHGVEHGDPSLCTVMYHPIRKCGILTDFDFSVIPCLERVLGIDRIGTIPFMAIELLCDRSWPGNFTRHYQHELEAFLWMLPIVFLAYDNGTFKANTPFIHEWITSNHNICAEGKSYFLVGRQCEAFSSVNSAFEQYKILMLKACRVVWKQQNARREYEFEQLLIQQAATHSGNISSPTPHIGEPAYMWDEFITVLADSDIDITRLQKHKPAFERSASRYLFSEITAI